MLLILNFFGVIINVNNHIINTEISGGHSFCVNDDIYSIAIVLNDNLVIEFVVPLFMELF